MIMISLDQINEFAKERQMVLVGAANQDVFFTDVKPIGLAQANDVCFCRFDGDKGVELIRGTKSALVFIPATLVNHDLFKSELLVSGKMFAICDIPRLEMAYFLRKFWRVEADAAIYLKNSAGGLVHPAATIAATTRVMSGAIVGANVSIGENTTIHPGAVIDNASIGANCTIGANAVIGSVGFGFEKDPETDMTIDFPHIGTVRIANHVRIGACTCIDRASIGETIISEGVKIDNLVHIGHNAKIGEGTKIVALSIVGGSAQIGNNCWLAPASAIRDWIQLGNDAVIGMGAVVTKSVGDGTTVVGNPAREIKIVRKRYL